MHSRLFLFHKSHIYITVIIIEPHSELIWAPIVIILPCIPYHWSIPVATIGTYRRLGSRSRLTIASILHYLWSPLLILLRAYILLSIVIANLFPVLTTQRFIVPNAWAFTTVRSMKFYQACMEIIIYIRPAQ